MLPLPHGGEGGGGGPPPKSNNLRIPQFPDDSRADLRNPRHPISKAMSCRTPTVSCCCPSCWPCLSAVAAPHPRLTQTPRKTLSSKPISPMPNRRIFPSNTPSVTPFTA